MKYFCKKETKTGLAIQYDESSGFITVVTTCCPSYGVVSIEGICVDCSNCGSRFGGGQIEEAVRAWSPEWLLPENADVSVATEWVSTWTGIPSEDITITIVETVEA